MNLEIRNVTKAYGKCIALDDFSISLHEGIYGLLGPNGAGKTTLMNILCTLLKSNKGSILLDGVDIVKMKSDYLNMLGYMPQYTQLYEDFTLEEYIYYMGALKGIQKQAIKERAPQLLRDVHLEEQRGMKLKTFSGGMKQRVMLVQALLNNPKILILDEPTAGLDPKQRISLRNLIAKMSKDKIVLISTHVVSDVEFISKEIILIKHGTCIAFDCPQILQKEIQGQTKVVELQEQDMEEFQKEYFVSSLFYEGTMLYARVVLKEEQKVEGKSVYPTLEDVYLYHFGEDDGTV